MRDGRCRAAHVAALFFAISGALAIVASLALPSALPDRPYYMALGGIDLAIAMALRLLPWQRWPRQALLVVVPTAYIIIDLFAALPATFRPYNHPVFFILVAVWIGLAFAPHTALALAPLTAIAYVVPMSLVAPMNRDYESVLVVLPVCVLISEIIARNTARAQAAQEQLRLRIGMLQQQDRELRELRDLNEVMLLSGGVADAYPQIARSLRRLFPGVSVQLAVSLPEQEVLEIVAYGGARPERHCFAPAACWALRRRAPHVSNAALDGEACGHQEPPDSRTLCIPMRPNGELLAVLIVRLSAESDSADRLERLAHTVAGKLELALTNLRLKEVLRQQALRDPLTGLFNRRFLEEALELEFRRAQRNQSMVAVLMADLDYFKRVNDTYGHQAGDVLLKEVGLFLQNSIRGGDIVFRVGGEEFLLMLPDIGEPVALERAEQLRAGVKELQPVFQGLPLPRASFSIGIALYPLHAATSAELIGCADEALYDAKRQGRDRVELAGRTRVA